MQHKGIIVVKNQGKQVPDQFLEKVLEKYPSCYGVAFATEGDVLVDRTRGTLTLEDLKDQLENILKDHTVTMFFGEFPNDFNDDDIMPMVLLGTNESPLLISFVEGDFSAYKQEESKHSDQFFFTHKVLIPQAKQIYDLTEGNWDKVMGALQQDHTKRMLLNGVDAGCITLLDHRGELVSHVAGTESAKFDWGFTSQTLGYKEGTYPEKKEESKKDSLAARLHARLHKSKEQEPPKTEPQPKVEAKATKPDVQVVDTKGKTDTAAVVSTSLVYPREIYMQSPPEEIIKQSNKAVKQWYKNHCGLVPHNWKEYPKIEVKGKARRNAELVYDNKMGRRLGNLPEEGKEEQVNTEVQNDKPTSVPVTNKMTEKLAQVDKTKLKQQPIADTKSITQKKEEEQGPALPVSSSGEKKAVEELLIKALDKNSKSTWDPEQFQQLEKKYPLFTEEHGLSGGLMDIVAIGPKSLQELCTKYPVSAASLLREALSAWYKLVPAEVKKPKEEQEEDKAPVQRSAPAGGLAARLRKAS